MTSDAARDAWRGLSERIAAEEAGVAVGRMMSADALTYAGKVFVFFSTKGAAVGLGGKVGREADPVALGLVDWAPLAPFKTKPPMKDWIVAGAGDLDRWPILARFCLDRARRGP